MAKEEARVTRGRLDSMSDVAKLRGGEFQAVWGTNVRAAVRDCASRPHLDKKRKITVTMEITPNVDSRGRIQLVVEMQGKVSLPAATANPAEARIGDADTESGQAMIVFSSQPGDDADQLTLDEADGIVMSDPPDEGG